MDLIQKINGLEKENHRLEVENAAQYEEFLKMLTLTEDFMRENSRLEFKVQILTENKENTSPELEKLIDQRIELDLERSKLESTKKMILDGDAITRFGRELEKRYCWKLRCTLLSHCAFRLIEINVRLRFIDFQLQRQFLIASGLRKFRTVSNPRIS